MNKLCEHGSDKEKCLECAWLSKHWIDKQGITIPVIGCNCKACSRSIKFGYTVENPDTDFGPEGVIK